MMNVYSTLESIEYEERTVVTLGTFDGVHLGHQAILEELRGKAAELQARSLVLTFHPHPQEILKKTGNSVPILTPVDRKLALLDGLGIHATAVIPFTSDFAATPWQEFVDRIRSEAGMIYMVVGHDHAFGKNRQGDVDSLHRYAADNGFGVDQVGPRLVEGEAVSSTRIRRALGEGRIADANRWLGRFYEVDGTVVRGDGRGRKIGLPTANIDPTHPNQLLPADGVYAVTVQVEGDSSRYRGMANIGVRPTFTDSSRRTFEVNLFDFDDEIYDRRVVADFRSFVRSERAFGSGEEFMSQIEMDRAAVIEALK